MSRKFPQQVRATIHRIPSIGFKEPYLFIRKNTCVHFGPSMQRHGVILMSNPGSYTPNYPEGDWEEFRKGKGPSQINGWGYPDPTMQNVIKAVQLAAEQTNALLEGIIEIYNISAIIQPKGENAEAYHSEAIKALQARGDLELLTEDWLDSQEEFQRYAGSLGDGFLIMGFAHQLFKNNQTKLISWARECDNVYYAEDEHGRWSHPRRWRTELPLAEQIQKKLKRHFLKSQPKGD